MSRYVGSLFFLFWVVANVLELTLSYFMWFYTGVQATGAWSYSVDSVWYAMAFNQMMISSLVGLGLFYFARYGVLFGLTIAMYALCVYQGYQLLKLIG
ncbi:MAG TPA: hypothetical protein G4O09_03090 [Dehalococcoidia bacterium]|nr:hypothetical protein [Dehalococcoidia bacterium]